MTDDELRDRQTDRAQRHADREARREERRRVRAEMRGGGIGDMIRKEIFQSIGRPGRKWRFDLGDAGFPGGGAEVSEVVEHRFAVSAMPRVHVSNVSGETEITVGNGDEVLVRARKRVQGWSEDRARRLLENLTIRLDQEGDDIFIEPRLFEQERGWLEMFRGGRVAVDLDIRVPRETHVDGTTVSGDLSLTGTRGPVELRAVSGELSITDVQGPLQLRTVSGDVNATGYAGRLEANSVSGEIEIASSRVRAPDVVTVSGDVTIDVLVVPADGAEGRVKTVSGDVDIVPGETDLEIDFKSVSGDAVVEAVATVEKDGRRDRRIVLGRGGARFRVKTVSGDLRLRATPAAGERDAAGASVEDTIPMGPPTGSPPPAPERPVARDILERLARGEIGVDAAAAELDAAKG